MPPDCLFPFEPQAVKWDDLASLCNNDDISMIVTGKLIPDNNFSLGKDHTNSVCTGRC